MGMDPKFQSTESSVCLSVRISFVSGLQKNNNVKENNYEEGTFGFGSGVAG